METPGTELRIPAITSVLTGRTLETLADEPGSAGTPYGSRHQQVKPERTFLVRGLSDPGPLAPLKSPRGWPGLLG